MFVFLMLRVILTCVLLLESTYFTLSISVALVSHFVFFNRFRNNVQSHSKKTLRYRSFLVHGDFWQKSGYCESDTSLFNVFISFIL